MRLISLSVNRIGLDVMGVNSRLLKLASVLVRFDHAARFIVNANHCTMLSAALAGVADCVAGSVRSVIPQPTERQRIGNQVDAAFIAALPDFVKVRRTLRVAGGCEFKYLVAWSG